MVDIQKFTKNGYICPAGKVNVDNALNLYMSEIVRDKKIDSCSKTSFSRFSFFNKEMNPHLLYSEINELVNDEQVVRMVKSLIGVNVVCINTIFIAKPPRSNDHLTLHQDSVYWGLKNNHALSIWIALTNSNLSNGCMQVIPGTHCQELRHKSSQSKDNILQMKETCEECIDGSKLVPMELGKGEFSVHHCQIAHMSSNNQSNDWRIGLVLRYANIDTLDEDYLNKKIYSPLGNQEHMPLSEDPSCWITQEKKWLQFNRQYFRKLNHSALAKNCNSKL
ncbi:phytanoyl-CoA dioxygenase family protein [Prochlorococcus marinus]|uniref:phytanoyl-CoA dioxygenase family protein n=1 Tax=Prochlorococcus TaxID=1218 RepID=UPI0007B3E100|nr:phytanoyl-CoA dioxygenase family protein [Prochlorococcus marinus]KZR77515.1 Phytanoyl-CoA dioxygenase (PhyH) [Prochlorococcus marinus str. MIT 1323]